MAEDIVPREKQHRKENGSLTVTSFFLRLVAKLTPPVKFQIRSNRNSTKNRFKEKACSGTTLSSEAVVAVFISITKRYL